MNDGLRSAVAALVLAASAATLAQDAPQSLPKIRLNAGIHNIDAQLAQTPQQREIGLMFRASMPANEGMLFTFERASRQCFWMKNTLIPLDMIFITRELVVAGVVENATPETDTLRSVGVASSYVLEVNGGWAAKHGVRAGTVVRFDGVNLVKP